MVEKMTDRKPGSWRKTGLTCIMTAASLASMAWTAHPASARTEIERTVVSNNLSNASVAQDVLPVVGAEPQLLAMRVKPAESTASEDLPSDVLPVMSVEPRLLASNIKPGKTKAKSLSPMKGNAKLAASKNDDEETSSDEATAEVSEKTVVESTSSHVTQPSKEVEENIRQQAKDYEKAFASGDSGAITKMWLDEGTYTRPDGVTISGAKEIKKTYDEFFDANGGKGTAISIKIEGLKALGDCAVLEKGFITGGSNVDTMYQALHVRDRGEWKIAKVTEELVAAPQPSISELSWLVGSWNAEGKNGRAKISTSWMNDKHNLMFQYDLETKDGKKHSDTQVLGVEPTTGALASWIFDSDGGVGKAYWNKVGETWVIDSFLNKSDGTELFATQVIRPIGSDSYTWKSTGVKINGMDLPDQQEITIKKIGNDG